MKEPILIEEPFRCSTLG